MRASRQGTALVLTFMGGALLAILAGSALHVWRLQYTLVERDLALQRAQEAARAGLVRACLDLALDSRWAEGYPSSTSRLTSTGASYGVSFAEGPAPYSVNNVRGGAGRAATGYLGRVVPPGCAHLVSQGWCGKTTTAEEALVWVMPRVRGAVSAQGRIVLGHASDAASVRVDSWDSRRGGYAPERASTSGHLLSNRGPVTLAGLAHVRGNVILGEGATASPTEPGRAYAARVFEPLPCPFTLVPPAHPPQDPVSHQALGPGTSPRPPLPPGAYGTLAATGTSLVFTSGIYRFKRIVTAGDCSFHFDTSGGPIVIHLDGEGDTDLSHATLANPSREARNLLIVGTQRATGTIRLATGPLAYAVVWAPTAHVVLRGQGNPRLRDFFGALAGAAVTVEEGAALHYDEALEIPPVVTRALQRIPLGPGQGGS